MGRKYSTSVPANTNIPTVNETDCGEVTGITTGGQGKTIRVSGWAQVTAGVGATALTARIRRGQGIGGAVVGEGNPVNVAAGNTVEVEVEVEDQPGDVDHQAYTLTVQQTAATGAGTALQAEVAAEVSD